MQNHHEFSDQEFKFQFKSCGLPPEVFTHEAHLRLAWLLIREHGIETAISLLTRQLKNYVIHLDAESKYNETLTVAATRAVYHFMLRAATDNFQDFLLVNPRLKYNFKELMFAHYKTDIFKSERAKQAYLEPELLPFD